MEPSSLLSEMVQEGSRVVRYIYDLRAETDNFQPQGLHDHINRLITILIESKYDVNL